MGKVLAALMLQPHAPLEMREIEEPELEPDSALLEVELSEVCGTDVHLRAGRLAGVPYPIIPGHVSVGWLKKIRGKLLDVEGRPFSEGDRVTFLDVHKTCNACWYCLVAKATTRCPQRKVYGITYGLSDGLTGGWSQEIYLKPATRCIGLKKVKSERFMAGGCALPTALHAVERADIGPGDRILVLGSGPVGLSLIILARMQGAVKLLCIGSPEHRLEVARAVGASAVCDIRASSVEERLGWVLEQTGGRGADVTIEATGDPAAVVQAMRCTRDAGRVVVAGQYTDHGETSFNPHADLNRKHLDIRGCWGSDFSHFYRGIQILSDPVHSKPWCFIPLHRYSLAHADQALDDVASGKVVKALIDPKL